MADPETEPDDLDDLDGERETDDPTEAESELLDRLGVPPGHYRSALAPSIAHLRAATPLAGAPPWRELGPRNIGGRVRDLAQAPLAAATLYAGSAFGGVWRTTDGGESWQVVGGPGDAVPVGALAVTRIPGRGLFQVTLAADAAAAVWTPLADVPDPPSSSGPSVPSPNSLPLPKLAERYARVVIDPTAPDRFWAASETGLWRREGDRFVDDVEGDDKDVTDVALAAAGGVGAGAAAGLRLYVAIRNQGVFSFTFAGGAASGWKKLKSLERRIRLAVCREQPQHVFAVAVDDDGFATAVHHSADRGDRSAAS